MRHIILNVTSPYEEQPSRTIAAAMWKQFLAGGTSLHSKNAATLPYLVRRAEREGIPYMIKADPGQGYAFGRWKDEKSPEVD